MRNNMLLQRKQKPIDESIPNYHEKAQTFIKSAHAQGRNVTAEGGELIAHEQGTYGTHLDSHNKMMQKNQMSQRDRYEKAMRGATKKGGSNGVGVGY